ncbi:hypothetical protein XELAEV_18046419mg [Xenopus laevis]|uniref:Uncharacterized protein n=1 Tax=Xenopus laevis TaxID=8355 RepID=A0A974BT97_XENLA|nr:hypothetical protein XELAEV_18046419mg [Xenopus laevis]
MTQLQGRRMQYLYALELKSLRCYTQWKTYLLVEVVVVALWQSVLTFLQHRLQGPAFHQKRSAPRGLRRHFC